MNKMKGLLKKYGIGFAIGIAAAAGCLVMDVGEWSVTSDQAKNVKYTIVVDSGHGGIDPGKVSADGAYEKDINLAIALKLRSELQKRDCQVVMTRENDEGLYDSSASNKKMSDMKKRIEIMNNSNPDLIISIHQNSFSDTISKGAQVFYQASSETGKALAETLQNIWKSQLDPENNRQCKANNDYYLLQHSEATMVIVECGFMSNPGEAAQLQTEEYQSQIAAVLADGVIEYLEQQDGKEAQDDNESTTDQPGTVSE
ncbi:MAG: N-acetylmuramoyl-L-alanine amidase CwlD [Lachnospiraceae bacterium]|nr:N-acetylmuramoyl-L-alanine amidase CwlD [Lachnospiraceae bacterium]